MANTTVRFYLPVFSAYASLNYRLFELRGLAAVTPQRAAAKVASVDRVAFQGVVTESLSGSFAYEVRHPTTGGLMAEGIIVLSDDAGPYIADDGQDLDLSSVASADSVAAIQASLTTGAVLNQPLSLIGQFKKPLVIGDDYRVTNQRDISWLVDPVPGFDIADVTTFFGLDGGRNGKVVIEGSVVASGAKWKLQHELRKAETSHLKPGEFCWSTSVHDQNGTEITMVHNDKKRRVELIKKQT